VFFQRLITTVVLTAFLSIVAFGQQTTATLTGAVTDPTGALVPGVMITVTNLATNGVRETKTDETGTYTLPFLPAGDYSITAVAAGFQTQKIDRVTLQVQQTLRVDLQLRIGDVAETVSVEALAVALQTDNATVGTVIDGAKIVDLPLNGRNFVQLAQLIPACKRALRDRLQSGVGEAPSASRIRRSAPRRCRRMGRAIRRIVTSSTALSLWTTTR
jgi:hypothetical protein